MVLLWLLDAALAVLEWGLGLVEALPTLSLPAALSLVIPVPIVGAAGVAWLNSWFAASLAVVVGIVAVRAVEWLYDKIPMKAT